MDIANITYTATTSNGSTTDYTTAIYFVPSLLYLYIYSLVMFWAVILLIYKLYKK